MVAQSNLKILFLDDFKPPNQITAQFLKSKFEVITQQLKDIDFTAVFEKPPSLIIVNINQQNPEVLTFVEKVRQKFNMIQLPIVVLSQQMAEEIYLYELLNRGVNDCHVQPTNNHCMLARILTQLKIANEFTQFSYLKENEIFDVLVRTINHEINNPLTIAIGSVRMLKKKYGETEPQLKVLENACWRINKVVKDIDKIEGVGNFSYSTYLANSKMLKLG